VSFAFVFEHLEPKRWLFGVVEVVLEIITLKMVNTGLQADGAFFKYS
jgi:hypothetical protein